MAAGLRGRGVHSGDRVVLAMLDSPEFTASFLAALRIGAIPVLVNPLLPWRDIGVVVEDAKADLVLVSEERQEGSEEVAAPRLVTGSDEWAAVSAATGDGSLAPTDADSPGFWLCTSGSTGRPKLAMHRHGDLEVTADTYARSVLDVGADDVFFSVGPMFHAYGLGNSLTFPMAVGAMPVLEAKRPPTPPRIAEIVTQHQPSLFFAIPAFYAALERLIDPGRHLPFGPSRRLRCRVVARRDVAPLPRPLRRRDPRRHRLDRDDAHLPVEPRRSSPAGHDGFGREWVRGARR